MGQLFDLQGRLGVVCAPARHGTEVMLYIVHGPDGDPLIVDG